MFKNKIRLSIIATILTFLIIGTSAIVSSQSKRPQAETSSPAGLKPKPDNLITPQNNKNLKNQKKSIPQGIPADVAYRQIFKHIVELNRKAGKEDKKRGNGRKLRNLYKKMARLSEKQARTLDRIAIKANRELKDLDDRAKKIIGQIRSQTPGRRIEPGQKVPLPTPELLELAEQRKDITLKAIHQLREAFGEAEFVKFTKFINERVKPGIKRMGNGTAIKRGGRK